MDYAAQLSDLLSSGDSEPSVQQRAASLAAALRQQQQQAQQQEFMGGLGSVFGPERAGVGKSFANLGAQNYADAQGQLEQIPKTLEVRLQRALEKQRNDRQAAHDTAGEKYQAAELGLRRQQLEQGKFAPLAPGGQVYNTRTGELGAVGDVPKPAPGGGGAGGLKESDWQKVIARMNSGGARAGELGANQKRINAALRLQKLYTDQETGTIRDLDRREIGEAATSLQALLSPGGHSAGEVHQLIPETYQGNVQGFLEKVLNEPRGVGMQSFTQKLAHTVEREMQAAEDSNKSMRLETLPGDVPYFKADRKRYESILRGHHIDPASLDENLLALPPAGGGAGTAPMTPEQRAKRKAELKAIIGHEKAGGAK